MLILGIDSSDDFLAVGLAGPDGAIISISSEARSQNKNMLHTFLAHLMLESGFKMSELKGVALSIGPGSFTGLRVGLAVGKGICWSLKLPLAGVSSLAAVAFCATIDTEKILTIKDARRGEFYYAGFARRGALLERQIPDTVGPPGEIPDIIAKGFRPAGPGVLAFSKSFAEGEYDQNEGFDKNALGGAVARLGREMIMSGNTLEMASAAPHYIRAPKVKEWNH